MDLLGESHLAGPTRDGELAPGEETGKAFTFFHGIPPQASLVVLLPTHEPRLQRLPVLLLNTHPRLS